MSIEQEPLIPTNKGITNRTIEEEISESYIQYAMAVIVSRALPDTRDGFKPVLRRILYAMYQGKLFHNAKYKKSANVVGDVMGKYHPHGDSSIYEAMVRLAQPWSMRYPLVDGQGNFWSVDGDGAAAMRYTESRLTKIGEEMLEDIDLDTVDWRPNYDNSLMEPIVVPTKFPNHLCNGTMGIAVGMATNMAPHNLTEVLDACMMLIANPEATIDDIMEIIKWPDFPTGGQIFGSGAIREIYTKGKWSILCRGKTHIETNKTAQYIIIDELPYQVNKAKLVEKVAELVWDKKIEWISDIIDESSNKTPIRVVIECKRGVSADTILTQLYKYTELQTNFSLNNVSLVERGMQPRLVNIKELLTEYIDFRREVVLRRSTFLLGKAKDRLHILEGLKRAIDIIDAVIALIRGSQTTDEAKNKLMSEFDFSPDQADYILALRLSRLVWLEMQKILDEIDEKNQQIAELTEIITNPVRRDEVIVGEMEEIKRKHGDERRTEVIDSGDGDLSASFKQLMKAQDLKKEPVICLIDNEYNVKVLYQSRIQNIPDETIHYTYTHNQDKLIVMTDIGELVVERLKDLGSYNIKSTPLNPKEHWWLKGNIVFCNTIEDDFEDIMFCTTHNNIKKIKKDLVLSFKKFPTIVMNLEPKEKITSIIRTKPGDHVWVLTQGGWMVLFAESELRPMGKWAGWVKGIELQEWDKVAGMFVYQQEPFIMVYSDYAGKLLNIEDLKFQKRARKGQIVALLDDKEKLTGAKAIEEWNLRIKLSNGETKTIHNDVMKLDDPESYLEPLTQVSITMVYTPRQESDKADKKKLEEQLAAEQTTKEQSTPWLFE
jgi:DNA gyrase subunit A